MSEALKPAAAFDRDANRAAGRRSALAVAAALITLLAILIGTVMLASGAVWLTSRGTATAGTATPPPQFHSLATGNTSLSVFPTSEGDDADQGPTSSREYDVTAVLERLEKTHPGDAVRTLSVSVQAFANAEPQVEEGRLTVETTESRHRELSEILDAWAVGGDRQIVVEVRIIAGDLQSATAIDWTNPIPGVEAHGPLPVLATGIDETQLVALLTAAQGSVRSNVLQAPKVTLFNGQRATIADAVQRPFVTAVEPQADGSLKPVIEVIDEGQKIELRAAVTNDDRIELTFDVVATLIEDVEEVPMPYLVRAGSREMATVQAPQVKKSGVRGTATLSVGETVLVAAPQPLDADRSAANATFYAITPRLLDAEIEEVRPAAPPLDPESDANP